MLSIFTPKDLSQTCLACLLPALLLLGLDGWFFPLRSEDLFFAQYREHLCLEMFGV